MKTYYQPKGGKKGAFTLRENTYRRIWYLIADYRYFKYVQAGLQQAKQLKSGGLAGTPNPVKVQAPLKVAEQGAGYMEDELQFERYIAAIEAAQKEIPEVYVDYIMSHIIEKKKYKDMEGVSERTLKIWTQRFIWHVANNLGEV